MAAERTEYVVYKNHIFVHTRTAGPKDMYLDSKQFFSQRGDAGDMSFHISKQCASAFYHLHNISRIRRFLSTDTTKALVHAFVTSCVDYCNSLLFGLPASHLNKVQRVLSAAARLVCRAPHYCRIITSMLTYVVYFNFIIVYFK